METGKLHCVLPCVLKYVKERERGGGGLIMMLYEGGRVNSLDCVLPCVLNM